MTPEQKIEFLQTANFILRITTPDGDPYWVELRRIQWYQQNRDRMWVAFYVEFPSYAFEPGKYLFEGFWALNYKGELFEHYDFVTVEFT
jgi:hypothetical protein